MNAEQLRAAKKHVPLMSKRMRAIRDQFISAAGDDASDAEGQYSPGSGPVPGMSNCMRAKVAKRMTGIMAQFFSAAVFPLPTWMRGKGIQEKTQLAGTQDQATHQVSDKYSETSVKSATSARHEAQPTLAQARSGRSSREYVVPGSSIEMHTTNKVCDPDILHVTGSSTEIHTYSQTHQPEQGSAEAKGIHKAPNQVCDAETHQPEQGRAEAKGIHKAPNQVCDAETNWL